MKKSARAHSVLVQNRQFHARIARKECGYFNEDERKIHFVSIVHMVDFFQILILSGSTKFLLNLTFV